MKMDMIRNFLDKGLFFLILFLIAFIPLYPKFPLFNVSGTFVAVRIEDFLIAITLLFWIFFILKFERLQFRDTVNRALILFFFIGGISILSAIFLTQSVTPHLGLLHFLRRMEFMFLMPVAATIINTKKRLYATFIVFALTLLTINIYALGQQYLDWPVISTTNSEFSKGLVLSLTPGARVNSTFAGHYDLAIYLSMALSLLAATYFMAGKVLKILVLGLSALSLFVLVLSAARVSFIAAFIGIILALIFAKKKKYLLVIILCIIIVLVYPSQLRERFLSTITVNLFNLGQRYEGRNLNQQLENKLNIPSLAYRIASRSASFSAFPDSPQGVPVDIAPGEPTDITSLGVYRSFQIRVNIEWPRAINATIKNPLLGTGYSSLGIATDNDFLRSLGEVGLLGTAGFGLILISIWKKVYQGLSRQEKVVKYFSAGVAAMTVSFLISGTFIDAFEASKVATIFWLTVGACLGVLKVGKF